MYSEKFTESLKAVEAAREANIKLEPARMTAQQKEDLLKAYHPDYKENEFVQLFSNDSGLFCTRLLLHKHNCGFGLPI